MGTERLDRDTQTEQAPRPVVSRPDPGVTIRRKETGGNATAGPSPLPDDLRQKIESQSGIDLSSVKVHYDSPEPAKINALAYAQGDTIHVAPGQEQHLPHEAWHVVQQMQGRVQPSAMQLRGHAIDDESALEREAETMGTAATRVRRSSVAQASSQAARPVGNRSRVVQRMQSKNGKNTASNLAQLNALLKTVGSSASLVAEHIDPEPSADALDKAIAASSMVIEKSTTRSQLIAEITGKLGQATAKGKKGPVDPMEVRRQAAKACKSYPAEKGTYYGGGANALHVHDVGGAFHLKGPGGDRKNIYGDNKLRVDALSEARKLLVGHPLAATLNAAIDKALIAHGQTLDNY